MVIIMIKVKEDLKRYIALDNKDYYSKTRKDKFFSFILQDEEYKIYKYKKLLRYQEFHFNNNNRIRSLYYCYRKNRLGTVLGFLIPINCFNEGILIYHYGSVIINNHAKIGKNCKIHGNNCIGNNGTSLEAPILGDNVDIGFGATIIGAITIGNNVKIGAGSVIVNNIPSNCTVVGVPGKVIKYSEKKEC